MKKNSKSPQKTFIVLSAIVCFVTLSQCKGCKDKVIEDPYADVKINPLFATDPPIAAEVNISELKDSNDLGNLLYEAALPREKIKADVLALMVNDSNKIVLHDDGKNGDRIPGDGIFSTVMNVNTDSLRTFLNEKARDLKRLIDTKQHLFQFVGRLEFPVDKNVLASLNKFADVGIEKIDFRSRFSIIPSLLVPLLTPVTESFKHNSLMVTDPLVINDPSRTFNPCTNKGTAGGAWTFGKLMTDMANTSGVTPENFVLNWLNTWNAIQTVNSDNIPNRNINSIINSWHTLCGGPAAPLDVNKAPFKLLAIVNRFDLRLGGGAYGGGTAGEGRFVFCAIDDHCNVQSFFVIFEYGVNKTKCPSIHAYAKQWINLASLTLGSPAYNTALQAITDQFAKAGTSPSKPNQSSLNQLRTNEVSIGFPWELREFHINPSSHLLFNVTTKREPQIPFNGQGGINTAAVDSFGEFVNANMRNVINDKMEIPDNITVAGVATPFIAGKAHTLDPSSFHWDALVAPGTGHIINDTARFHISLNTCSGCHGGEANTGNFTQVGLPVSPGGPAHLSSFLTGDPAFSNSPFMVSDRAGRPSGTPIQWPFNDLERRGRDLMDFNAQLCLPVFHTPVLKNQHIPFGVPVELTKRLTFMPVTMTD